MMIDAGKEKVAILTKFLHEHTEEIYERTTKKYAEMHNNEHKKKPVLHKADALRVIVALADSLEDSKQETSVFEQLGERIARKFIAQHVTLTEAMNEILHLKEAILEKLEQAGCLYILTVQELYAFSSLFMTHCDKITSKLALEYSNSYGREEIDSYATTLTENLIDAVVSTDNEYKIVSWNKGAETLYGWTLEEVLGRYVGEVLKTEYLDKPNGTKEAQEAVAKYGMWKGEAIQTGKDGKKIPVLAFVSAVKDAKNRRIGTVAVNRDIAEQKRNEMDNAFLATLSESIRLSTDDEELVADITRRTGQYLQAARCYLAEIFEDEDLLLVKQDYHSTLPSFAGKYRLSDYGSDAVRVFQKGQVRVVEDTKNDALTMDSYKTSYEPMSTRAFIAVPCRRNGHSVATLAVFTDIPREWQQREVFLMETIAERMWNGIEKLRSERALQESEEKFHMMANNIPNLAWMAKPDGNIYWYNKRWYDYTGTTPKDVEGWGWQSVHNPETLPLVLERWNTSLATGKRFDMVFPLKDRDGVFRPFLTRVMPVKDNEGNVIHWFGTNTDIGEQIQTEEELRVSKEKYETLFKSIDEGFCIIECIFDEYNTPLDYRFLESNAAFERHTNLKNPNGKTVLELVPNIEYFWIKTYGTVALTGSPVHVEDHVAVWNKWFDVYAFPTGKPEEHKVAVLFNDISERKRAEEELRKVSAQQEETLALLESLLKNAPIGFAFFDREHHYIRVNDSLAEINGIAVEDHIGKTVEELLPENAKTVGPVLDKVVKTREPVLDLEVTGVTPREPEATRYWITGFYPVFIGKSTDVNFVGAVVLEITAMKKLEHQKDEFLAVASHELKTPVTSIKAYAQVLQRQFKSKGDTQSFGLLSKLDAQINKLIALIADLLDVSKMQAGKLQLRLDSFDFQVLVTEIVDEIQRTTTQHTIHTEFANDKMVYGDRDRLGQVITNFLTNAVKYSPHADLIVVKTQADTETITLSVQDFGLGIPEEKQAKVFERFYRVEGSKENIYPGLGLGLYISSEIISRHGGTVWVKSGEGQGSTFSFTIPIQEHVLPQPEDTLDEEVIQHE